jgi:hypothetical protein
VPNQDFSIFFSFLFFPFFGSTEGLSQCLVLTMQALYCLSHTPALFAMDILEKGSGLDLSPSILYFLL